MALDFPASPTTGQTFSPAGGPTYIYNGTVWALTSVSTAETRNRIINGNMSISQENANTAGTTNAYYGADQFVTFKVHSAGTMTTQRVQSVTPNGSKDRYRVTITAADASLAAGEYLAILTGIEGQRVADLRYGSASAQPSILRFGWKAPAGTYSVAIQNSAINRSYVANFTISAGQANTDTVQTFIIPGDTTGTWLTDTGAGLWIYVVMAAGTTFQGAAGWQATTKYGTSSNSNGMGTASAVFELYDVGWYYDPLATGVAPRWQAPDPITELAACQRYYAKLDVSMFYQGLVASVTQIYTTSVHPVPMRIVPALGTVSAVGAIYDAAGSVADATTFTAMGLSSLTASSVAASKTGGMTGIVGRGNILPASARM